MATTAAAHPRYRIRETLGKGGMGEVCLADDLVLDRPVAVKFLVSPPGGDPLDQLLTEARAAAALDHPFICKIFEVTELGGRPCIVMEYVRGETLERRLRRGPLAVADAVRLAEEVAEALEAAHKRGVVHRDLKPANVMIAEDGHVKVMDFGVARRLPVGDDDAADRTLATAEGGVLVGTPAYVAPEQIHGRPADRRSDIFSFGVLLYEALAGIHPFRRARVESLLAAIVAEEPPNLHDRIGAVPPALAAIVARMLVKAPEARVQSFAQVRLELRRVGGELGPPAASAPIGEPLAQDDARPLVGRESDQAELLQFLARAVGGRGALVVIRGEPGIGKSRLAEEALAAARRLGCQTFVGRCREEDGTPPLLPYVEVLEQAARLLPVSLFREAVGRSAPELATLVPELYRLFPDLASPLELPPELRQRFLFTNIREFLTRCSQAVPLAIVLDDLQWADEPTLQLTEHLAQPLDTMRAVVIGVYQDVETAPPARPRTHALHQLFERMRGRPHDAGGRAPAATRALEQLVTRRLARAIRLKPLTLEATAAMLASLGPGDPPDRLARQIFQETEGNPFFIEELAKHLKEEGSLLDDRGRWLRVLDLDTVDVPASVRGVADRRLQRVSAPTLTVLKAAAVVGRHFELDLLEAVADAEPEAVAAALDEAERQQLVKGPSGRQQGRWRFAHQVVWQTLMASVPLVRRQHLHLRVADEIGRRDTASPTSRSDLAHHLYSAYIVRGRARTRDGPRARWWLPATPRRPSMPPRTPCVTIAARWLS